ncbi:hypothetical protein NB701_004441 [Pantoea ananatis]|nr:hypothetical protein [Pantoea ananatis]
MHHFLETLSEFLSNWPVISGERTERKPVKDRKKISSLHYRPICKITDDKTRDNDIPKKDEPN